MDQRFAHFVLVPPAIVQRDGIPPSTMGLVRPPQATLEGARQLVGELVLTPDHAPLLGCDLVFFQPSRSPLEIFRLLATGIVFGEIMQ
jgi:hypothetical protein